MHSKYRHYISILTSVTVKKTYLIVAHFVKMSNQNRHYNVSGKDYLNVVNWPRGYSLICYEDR